MLLMHSATMGGELQFRDAPTFRDAPDPDIEAGDVVVFDSLTFETVSQQILDLDVETNFM